MSLLSRKKINRVISITILLSCSFFMNAQNGHELKIDPELLILTKESQKVSKELGNLLFPEWKYTEIPILLYRPGVQDILINFPHTPEGFVEYKGYSPLKKQSILVRNDSTIIEYDDQNTTIQIDGIQTLVVADTYSSMRNQLKGVIANQSQDFVMEWLDNWNFLSSPYHKLSTMLHEGFHAYQRIKAPSKGADESVAALYPLLDPTNNSLYVLEGQILRDALLLKDSKEQLEKIKAFVAVRNYRQSLLDSSFVAYENLNEYNEGIAKYIELKLFKEGKHLKPGEEMNLVNGFFDYETRLPEIFNAQLDDMVEIASISDNRFGNKFGVGPLRFKLYYLGAAQGLLLDEVMPGWKTKIFDDGIFLTNLLTEAVSMSDNELQSYLSKAKSDYKYDLVFNDKLNFEMEGKKIIQSKVDDIMKTSKTLVSLNYESVEITGMAYTPFGITKVSDKETIYDMVPVSIRFGKETLFVSNKQFPVLVNTQTKTVYFTVDTTPDSFKNESKQLSIPEFSLSNADVKIESIGNEVKLKLNN